MSTPEHETITDLSDVRPDDVATFQKGPQTTLTGPVVYVIPEGGICLRSHGQVDDGWDFVSATRPAPPTPAPGTVGTATVEDGVTIRGMWTQRGRQPAVFIDAEGEIWGASLILSFVPDPDTAALQAEVSAARELAKIWREHNSDSEQYGIDLDVWLDGGAELVRSVFVADLQAATTARADAAEARLARVREGVHDAARSFGPQTSGSRAFRDSVLALVAADEQAAEERWPLVAGSVVSGDGNTVDLLDRAPAGTVVRDCDGDEWVRRDGSWWLNAGGIFRCKSADLAGQVAPLTVVSVPGVGGAV